MRRVGLPLFVAQDAERTHAVTVRFRHGCELGLQRRDILARQLPPCDVAGQRCLLGLQLFDVTFEDRDFVARLIERR